MNNHWEVYGRLVNPCIYSYKYILKQETIETESAWLFQKLNITNITYPKGHKDRTDQGQGSCVSDTQRIHLNEA